MAQDTTHLQLRAAEEPAGTHDSYNAAGKLHVPKCTAPRACAMGQDRIDTCAALMRAASRALALGAGAAFWGLRRGSRNGIGRASEGGPGAFFQALGTFSF